MIEKIFFKGLEVSLDKDNKNYVQPSMPLITKPCPSCGDLLELRPLRACWIKKDNGIYFVNREVDGKLSIKTDSVTDFLFGCKGKGCAGCETIKLNQPDEIIEIAV